MVFLGIDLVKNAFVPHGINRHNQLISLLFCTSV